MRARGLALLAALWAGGAWAQFVPEREVEIARSLYEAGKYGEALGRASSALGLGNFTDEQRVRLHELAGLSAFNLGDTKQAQAAFLSLLTVNPDHVLDPFAVPPPAIKLFEQVRRDNADALSLARQQIALRAEQQRRDEAERLRAEEEERRRRLEALNAALTVRTVERRAMALNFVPFGAGQFQQGRTSWGIGFAVSEGLMAVLSVVSYFAIEALYEERTLSFPELHLEPTVTVRAIPAARRTEYQVWSALKYGTGGAFYALWAWGAADALWHHRAEVVTEARGPLPPAPPPGARLDLTPAPGGLGARLTLDF